MLKKHKSSNISNLKWEYEPPKINAEKETIDDMSLIVGFYENFVLTKSGNLIGILTASGINLDLLNDIEQEDVFNDYNAFLMATVGEQVNEHQQYSDIPLPVDMKGFLKNAKRNYLIEKNSENSNNFKVQLMASYIDHYQKIQQKQNLTSKVHLLTVGVKVADKTEESLLYAEKELSEKMEEYKRNLETAFNDFDLVARSLTSVEIKAIFKNLINFKGKG